MMLMLMTMIGGPYICICAVMPCTRSSSSISTRNLACRYRRSRPFYGRYFKQPALAFLSLSQSQVPHTLANTMPRDLFTSDSRDESIVQSPLSQTPRADQQYIGKDNDFSKLPIELQRNESRELKRQPGNGRMHANEKNNLHPYVQTLSISNLESCVALENAIFPEPERCSREKVRIFRQSFISCYSLVQDINCQHVLSCSGLYIYVNRPPVGI